MRINLINLIYCNLFSPFKNKNVCTMNTEYCIIVQSRVSISFYFRVRVLIIKVRVRVLIIKVRVRVLVQVKASKSHKNNINML